MTSMEARVIAQWRAGLDTAAIAEGLNTKEAWVCRVLAADQDRRHAERSRAAAHSSSRILEPDHVRL